MNGKIVWYLRYSMFEYGKDYCCLHPVDIRKKPAKSLFYFYLNSDGGMVFDFSAKNAAVYADGTVEMGYFGDYFEK